MVEDRPTQPFVDAQYGTANSFLPIAIGLKKVFAENRHFHVSANLRYLVLSPIFRPEIENLDLL